MSWKLQDTLSKLRLASVEKSINITNNIKLSVLFLGQVILHMPFVLLRNLQWADAKTEFKV